MIMHKNMIPATKEERMRIHRMMYLPCVACSILKYENHNYIECHHIVEGAKRLGHWYTIPLCRGHHRGVWGWSITPIDEQYKVAICDGSKAFSAVFGSQRSLWEMTQDLLNLDKSWVGTKILPRRNLHA